MAETALGADARDSIDEGARRTPVAGSADVVVCGGGPAGVAAALRAAEEGASVLLLELHGALGGVWTSGLLSAVLDADKPSPVLARIATRLDADDARRVRDAGNYIYDAEPMKLVLEALCAEAGVRVRLLTRLVAARVHEGRLTHVVTESKSGREAWAGSVFVDATGDGDLAAFAGCAFEIGAPDTGETQPLSLMALIDGVDPTAIAPFFSAEHRDRKRRLLEEFTRAGFTPSYGAPTLFHVRDDLFAIMANHAYGVSALDADALSAATIEARQEIDRSVRALRSLGAPWAGLRLVTTAAQIGIREGRRIRGRAAVTRDDLLQGRIPVDSVTIATFGMDIHALNPAAGTATNVHDRPEVLPYGIPFGALQPVDVEGLLLAGRCISGDFFAHSSYRVTGNAVATGEAAGLAAARIAAGDADFTWPAGVRF